MNLSTAYAAIEHHLDLLYADAPEDAFLVLSYPEPDTGTPKAAWDWKSRWFQYGLARDAAIQHALQWTTHYDVYYGVCLRHPDCQVSPFRRGTTEEAYVVPGLWGDWDVATGTHKDAKNLPPTVEALLAFLRTLPAPPSLMLATGGGLHTYHLFREPWLIQNAQDRQAISHLAQRFQYTIHSWAKDQHGWDMTILADLPRVLRLPGCRNHKYANVEVELLHEDARRYNMADFDPWLLELEEPATVKSTQPHLSVGSLDLQALAEHYGVKLTRKSAQELAGAHPVHGSDTGVNLDVNLAKGLWHCWRHLKGGDALHFVAMCEGLLACEAMRQGALRGETFKKAVEIANEKFQAGIVLDAERRRNGQTPGPEPPDPYACPELPSAATGDDHQAAAASLWLDDYVTLSKKWAPRAYEGFHEAGGIFVLSTTGARRIKIQFGPRGVYTSLYMALASRTSLYTKTTAADIALGLLRRAGLRCLLADDDATPQAFLRSLTLHLPPDYDEIPTETQLAIRERLAFAGQKGWFYEEWGQHLQAMMQREGMMASFRSILRRLDDHQDEYVYSTISRGRDVLVKPYVVLLGCE